MGGHQVGLELPDEGDELVAHLQAGQERTVVVVQGDIFRAHTAARVGRLDASALGQWATAHFVVAGVTVGHTDHFYRMAQAAVERGQPTRAKVWVVRVCANDEKTE